MKTTKDTILYVNDSSTKDEPCKLEVMVKSKEVFEEYVHKTKEEMWEKGLRCDGEIDMGWEHFSEEDKEDLLEDDGYFLNEVRSCLMSFGWMIDGVYHIKVHR